jgi:hypothetical protein
MFYFSDIPMKVLLCKIDTDVVTTVLLVEADL